VCTTTYDEVCRACHRHYLEVANWGVMTQAEKDAVWARIEPLREMPEESSPVEQITDLVLAIGVTGVACFVATVFAKILIWSFT